MKIKHWKKFQHFKDRKPPWVKLYRDILDDLQWHELDPLAAKVLVMLWLIASEDEGRIPNNKTLAFRLRLTESKTKEIVTKLSHWLEQDDINTISDGHQHDLPEREREKEGEKEKEKDRATSVACPPDVDQQVWDDWKQLRKAKKAPVTETVVSSARKEASKANISFSEFLSVWCARGSQGLQADWLKPEEKNLSKTGQMNQRVISGLTRGLIGGGSNVKLLGE
jgi:hypothetical protein